MYMIIKILTIRLKQIYRDVSNIGLFRMLVAVVFLFLFFLFLFNQLQIYRNGIIAISVQILLIASIQINRSDKKFLSIISKNPYPIYLFEYLTFSLPIFILCFVNKRFDLVLYQIVGIASVSTLNVTIKKTNRNNFFLRLIPAECFEMKSGLRSQFWIVVTFYLVGVCLSFWVGTIPLIIFLLTAFFSGYFQECEPRNIIELKEVVARKFLKIKLLENLKPFVVLLSPLVILFLCFHYEFWYIILIEFLYSLLVFCFFIFLKYAMYQPLNKLQANSVLTGFVMISFFVPFLIPVVLGMMVWYYFKAVANLNKYLEIYK